MVRGNLPHDQLPRWSRDFARAFVASIIRNSFVGYLMMSARSLENRRDMCRRSGPQVLRMAVGFPLPVENWVGHAGVVP